MGSYELLAEHRRTDWERVGWRCTNRGQGWDGGRRDKAFPGGSAGVCQMTQRFGTRFGYGGGEMMSAARKQLLGMALLAAASVLGTWTNEGSAALTCCYDGEVADSRLAEVRVNLEDGRRLPFGELFPDFAPSTSFFTLSFPVYRLDIARVVYPKLAVILGQYDANENGFIEEPELTVLYMREAALGLHRAITHLGEKRPLRAIFATSADADGLVRFVSRRKSEMTPAARQTFDELDLLRRDFRFDGTEPGEQGDGGFGR